MPKAMGQLRPIPTERPRLSRRTTVFLACLGLSAFLWMLRTLSQEYAETLSIPVAFINPPEERILMDELPTNLEVQVQALGFDVLWHKLKPHHETLTIDFNEEKLRKVMHEGKSKQFLLTSSQLAKLDGLFSPSITELKLLPDTLYFQFVKLQSKKVPVKLTGEITYNEDAAPKGEPKIEPTRIVVYGPQELLSELKFVETESVKLKDVSENSTTKVALKPFFNSRLLSTETQEVEVNVNVIPAGKKELAVRYSIVGKTASRKWKGAPNEIKITVKAPRERLEKITTESFSFSIEPKDAKNGEKVKVRCDRKPEGILDITWEPLEVQLEPIN
jgi:hypothetical protein